MKLLKKLFMAGSLAMALVASASAQTTIHIIGSTSYRGQTLNAIEHLFGGNNYTYAFWDDSGTGSTDFSHSTRAIFVGTTDSTNTNYPVATSVIVKVAWTGSTGGIQAIAQSLTPTTAGVVTAGTNWWMDENIVNNPRVLHTGTSLISGTSSTGRLATIVYNENNTQPDMAMGDTFQDTTPYGATNGYTTATKHVIGILPFVWVKNRGGPATLTNATALALQAMFTSGTQLSLFTGVAADTSKILAMGRDEDSGTRTAALTECGYGANNGVTQWEPTITGTAGSGGNIAEVHFWPDNSVNNVFYASPDSGYASGALLSAALDTPGTQTATIHGLTNFTGASFIGYTSVGDGQTVGNASSNFSNVLSYNGVNYVAAGVAGNLIPGHDAVCNGQYTFWTYEQVLENLTLSGTAKNVVVGLAKQLYNTDAQSTTTNGSGTTIYKAIKNGDMNVGRAFDGGPITKGNNYSTFQ